LRHFQSTLVLNHWTFGFVGVFGFVVLRLAQIAFERNEHDFDAWAVFLNFLLPFRLHVLKRLRGVNLVLFSSDRTKDQHTKAYTETEHDRMCVVVRQRP